MSRRLTMVWFVVLGLIFPFTLVAQAEALVVVRIAATAPTLRAELANRLDVWEHGGEHDHVLASVDTADLDWLRDKDIAFEIDEKATFSLRRGLATMMAALDDPATRGTDTIPGFPCYRTVESTLAMAQDLATTRPDLVTLIDIGDSWAKTQDSSTGYDLLVVKITNSAVAAPPAGKPVFFMVGGTHARELAPQEVVNRFATLVVNEHGTDPDVTWLVDHYEIHILLNVNPDGRKEAEAGELWRKNANLDFCPDTLPGVDLNRNYPFEYACCNGSSTDPCSTTFRGPSALSEPESQAVVTYANTIFADQRPSDLTTPAPADATGLFLDMHSRGEYVVWSWGFTDQPPPNEAELTSLGRKYAFFNEYLPRQGLFYTFDGSTVDYGYGELGTAALTIEMGGAFFEPCFIFDAVVLDGNLDALRAIVKHAREPYRSASAPDTTDVRIDGRSTGLASVGDLVTVTATIDDTRYNNSNGTEPTQPITSAVTSVDLPPWLAPSTTAMSASDGTFDTTTESVTIDLDTTGLGAGRHLAYVAGSDSHTGVPTAAFLWLIDPAVAPTLQGTVIDRDTGAPLAATVSIGPFRTESDPTTGVYSLQLPAGTWDLTAIADGYGTRGQTGLTLANNTTLTVSLELPALEEIFFDDMESGSGGWTAEAPWAITTEHAYSGNRAWSDSPGANYGNGVDIPLTSPTLTGLTGYTDLTLSFWQRHELERPFDFGVVEVSADGMEYEIEIASTSEQSAWELITLPLDLPANPDTLQVRFRVVSDIGTTLDGWYVDDIRLVGAPPDTDQLFADGFESGDTSVWSSTVN
ncbi:MAG: M14 family zinc carboxypeptidase [Acidobacteriota bacterium]